MKTIEDIQKLNIKAPNQEVFLKVKENWDSISKPLDGLGDFETIICKILSVLEDAKVSELKKALVIMCADNGIVSEGVSQCGQENTLLVAKLLGEGRSTASTMAKFAGAQTYVYDVGINTSDKIPGVIDKKIAPGTKDFLLESAMTSKEALEAIEVGIEAVRLIKSKGVNIIATGEMGIGNTTTSTAVACALLKLDPKLLTGRGAGLSDEGLGRKLRVIYEGLRKYSFDSYAQENINTIDAKFAFDVLCALGGFDIAALCGVYIGGAIEGIPIVIDGFISAVAALLANLFVPGCNNFMVPSHSGREKGTRLCLDELGLEPFILGDMALGEGTGALMLFPLLDMMLDFYNNASTFKQGGIDNYVRQK